MRTAEEKGKRARTDGAEEDGGEPIDRALQLSIEKLQEIQDEIEKVNEEASDKVLEVEQKYNKIRRPVYVRRNEIIQKISDFWLTAFLSHPVLGDLLTEDDQQICKHLESIFVDESEDIKSGCSITLVSFFWTCYNLFLIFLLNFVFTYYLELEDLFFQSVF
jgi:template-activating factor I